MQLYKPDRHLLKMGLEKESRVGPNPNGGIIAHAAMTKLELAAELNPLHTNPGMQPCVEALTQHLLLKYIAHGVASSPQHDQRITKEGVLQLSTALLPGIKEH